MNKIITVLVVFGLLVATGYGVQHLQNSDNQIEVQKIKLQDKAADIKLLELKYQELDDKLNKARQDGLNDAERIKSLEADKKAAEEELKSLEAKLQAKNNATIKPVASSSVKYSTNCEAYRPLVAKYDWNVDTMMRIMKAESGCNPSNHNWADNHRSCMGSFGLFQIGCIHGHTVASLENPEYNIAAAYKVWNGGNYRAWTTY